VQVGHKKGKKSNKALEEAIRKRDEFLQMNPRLKPMQKEIDRQLEAAGDDPQKRLEVIRDMMKDLLENEMAPAMEELGEAIEDLMEEAERVRKEGQKE
jgi:alpha-acetolactate decarboxylase